jgi:hypothetical protein
MNKSFISNNSDIQNIFRGHDMSAEKIYGEVIAGPGDFDMYRSHPVQKRKSMPPRSPSPIFGRKKTTSAKKGKKTLLDYKNTCDYLEDEI